SLRRLTAGDADAIARLVDDWDIIKNLSDAPFPYPPGLAQRWIASTHRGIEERQDFALGIVPRDASQPIGAILLRQSQQEPAVPDAPAPPAGATSAEIGYWIGRDFWRHGYAAEAVRRMVRFAFDELGLDRVWGAVLTDNAPSRRVLERSGFKLRGESDYDFPARGGMRRVFIYAIERKAMSNRPARNVLVSAVALVDADGRVLLARRPAGKPMAGLWEFPGGKVKEGETCERALIRELKEELGIDVAASCLAPFTFASHRYLDFHLLMPLFVCRVWKGNPKPREGQELVWCEPARMAEFPMPPADRPLVAMLRDFL
ncbi:MAG: GNAT family N-acetyltransferase, partial [Alphaproteobacteria bacterium]|nr:GNAT family N-acetyltransferase [Alphaproteobacteria bacterium]